MGSGLLGFVPGYLQLGRGRGTVLTPPPREEEPSKKKESERGRRLDRVHHADSLRPQVRTRYMGAAAVERGRGVRLWLRCSGAAAWWSRRALGVGVLPTWNCGESAGRHVCEEGTGLVCQCGS